ncbi:PPM-type phosphatase domain-containing protein OS=Streptomyces antimycoticus OX=68175 GN=SSPO_019370 PE=4 SV=1 [Streptomyces antimycoticus]
MLPTLPEHLPGLEVAARYRPSQDGLDIGGNWYDAFVMPDGATALENGDGQGHEVDATTSVGKCARPCARSPPRTRSGNRSDAHQ